VGSAGVTPLFAKSYKNKILIELPKKKFTHYYKKGKKTGGRVLIIGGIHGNEMGAYKAADMLVDTDLVRGEMLIIPRSNFTSILADVRGYNGDMNRKFAYISKKDPDYYNVQMLKEAILSYRPDVVISMHDGFGFSIENHKAWGQSVVIDELTYGKFNLIKDAKFVCDNANKYLKRKLSIINTKTFTGIHHKEQKKALTGWCLKHGVKAYCIEASKQLPSVHDKIYTHLVMLREFFKLYKIELKGGIDYLIDNIDKLTHNTSAKITMEINGQIVKPKPNEVLHIKRGSVIKITDIQGQRGDYLIPRGVNLNWRSFHFTNLSFDMKRDYQKLYSIRIKGV
jgi:hypothetical protein